MGNPRKVAQTFDHYAVWTGAIGANASQQIAFVPIDGGAALSGAPPGASSTAVPCLVAHEILISNPGGPDILVTPATLQNSGGGSGPDAFDSWPPTSSNMKPFWVDPTTFPAPTASNSIIVPAGAIAFPIRVKSYGITIKAANGAVTGISVAAYGPLSLEA